MLARSAPQPSPAAFTPPSPLVIELARRVLEPWKRRTRPCFLGLERIPNTRPLLFVGNHTLFGVLDVPLLFEKLYVEKGIFLRSLGDHAHFKIPLWGPLVRKFGGVDGTPETCAQLMASGQAILVFPGGAREAAKRKGEKYRLIWQNRLGFARLAIQHRCTIVPFAALGAEDLFEILVDGDELRATRPGKLVSALGMRQDYWFPLAAPRGRLERFYFHFGAPIVPQRRVNDPSDAECRVLRAQTHTAITSGLAELEQVRAHDPERHPALDTR